MELDDLRRQWQQPEPATPPALTKPQLDALLQGRTTGLVEQMRRNARLETGFTATVAVGLGAALLVVNGALFRLYAGFTVVLAVGVLAYYYQVLGTLGRMAEPTGSVRGHLGTLAQGLRTLLRFYYRLTLAAGPLVMLLIFGFVVWKHQRGAWHGPSLAVVAGLFLLVGALAQVGIVYAARWSVQRLYGQHLDRLEGQLHELSSDEPAAPG